MEEDLSHNGLIHQSNSTALSVLNLFIADQVTKQLTPPDQTGSVKELGTSASCFTPGCSSAVMDYNAFMI